MAAPVSHLLLKLRCQVVVTDVKLPNKLFCNVIQLLPQPSLTEYFSTIRVFGL